MTSDDEKLEALATGIRRYFLENDFQRYSKLFHSLTRWELFRMGKEHQWQVEQTYKVTPFVIGKYSQSRWEIFKLNRYKPCPTHSIQMSLEFPDRGRVKDLFFACAPAGDVFEICSWAVGLLTYWTTRRSSEVIDLARLSEELRTVISSALRAVGSRLSGKPVEFLRLDYSIDPYPCSVAIYPYTERFDVQSWQKMVHVGGEYRRSKILAKGYRSLILGAPALLFDGRHPH